MKLSKYLKSPALMPAAAAPATAAPGAPATEKRFPERRDAAVKGAALRLRDAPAPPPATPSVARRASPTEESAFDTRPAGIYEAAQQMGIAIPDNRNLVLENAKSCLGTVFTKLLYEQGDHSQEEREMLWPMVKSIAMDIAHIVADDHHVLPYLHRRRAQKERLLWHSLYTAILAMDLAGQMKGLDSAIHEIGGAALLHDVGLILHPEDVDQLDMDCDPRYQHHVMEGVEMIRKIGVPENVARMIHDHHRRLDGQGFPPAPADEDFSMTSQIVAVAHVFEIMVIELSVETQTSKSGSAPANDMRRLLQQYRRAFDDELLKKMISIVGFYPVGCVVELDNRVIGAVIRQNPDVPLRPVIRVIVDGTGNRPEQEKILDLSQNRLLSVVRTLAYPHESSPGQSREALDKRSGGLT